MKLNLITHILFAVMLLGCTTTTVSRSLSSYTSKQRTDDRGSIFDEHIGDLSADGYWRLPISQYQRFSVTYQGGTWRFDHASPPTGPEGAPGVYKDSALMPSAQIGSLIGSVSYENSPAVMSHHDARKVFHPHNTFVAGRQYDSAARFAGWIYLRMNDVWSLGDNKGAIKVKVQIWRQR